MHDCFERNLILKRHQVEGNNPVTPSRHVFFKTDHKEEGWLPTAKFIKKETDFLWGGGGGVVKHRSSPTCLYCTEKVAVLNKSDVII